MLKISHEGELHIISKRCSFGDLTKFIRSSFKNAPEEFVLYYYDLEGDKIELTSEADLALLYTVINRSVRLYIEKVQPEVIDLTGLSDDEVTLLENEPESPKE